MDFIKKHYEKVLMGVVLVGLALAIAFLPFKIANERQKLEELGTSLINRPAQPLTNLDLTAATAGLQRLAIPASVDLERTNKVFNPMTWLKKNDGVLIRKDKAGPASAYATNFTKLYTRISFDSISVSADSTVKYVIGVEKQAALSPAARPKKQSYMKVGDKNDMFTLSSIQGPADNPTNLVLTLNEAGDTALVSREQPFQRVDGYTADVKYDVEKKSWPNRRVGAALILQNEEYKIVAIGSNEVVLLAPNQKKWTVKSNLAP
jgi:hypothetical protein